MRVRALFTDHPASLGETYSQHRDVALGYAFALAKAAGAALIHAAFPFLFQRTASHIIKTLNDRMAARCVVCPSARLHRPDLLATPMGPVTGRAVGHE